MRFVLPVVPGVPARGGACCAMCPVAERAGHDCPIPLPSTQLPSITSSLLSAPDQLPSITSSMSAPDQLPSVTSSMSAPNPPAARIAENSPEPFDREVTMCDQLSAYLRKFVVSLWKFCGRFVVRALLHRTCAGSCQH